jgi:hypothetical protein
MNGQPVNEKKIRVYRKTGGIHLIEIVSGLIPSVSFAGRREIIGPRLIPDYHPQELKQSRRLDIEHQFRYPARQPEWSEESMTVSAKAVRRCGGPMDSLSDHRHGGL